MKRNSSEAIEMNCPICDHFHGVTIQKRYTKALVKETIVEYEEVVYCCEESIGDENEFVPAIIMDENLLRARNAYRKLKGLLTSEEIASIRSYYKLSQSDFSRLFGWGEVTVTRYESKLIQDETFDQMMRLAHADPLFALDNLDKHKTSFTPEKYIKIKETILSKIDEKSKYYINKKIQSLYAHYQILGEYNGYQQLDFDKINQMIDYFAKHTKTLYKVKLAKLLWYCDALFYKTHHHSITGLVYQHKQYGALPIAFNEIIDLSDNLVEEVVLGDAIGYKILPNPLFLMTSLTHDELTIVQLVAQKFGNYSVSKIIDYMHQEEAYQNTQSGDIISFELTKNLNDFNGSHEK